MATRPVVPRATGEGGIGTAAKHWGAGYFDNLSLAGEDVAGTLSNMDLALVESTGCGIVSGCTPTISGLTVTVGAGVVHLADGTRKELSATNITLDSADPTNPRIDLVYIDSTGDVAKITGMAAASPVVPALPSGGISVAQVSVAANASAGTLTDMRGMLPRYYNTGIVNVKDYGAKGDGVHNDTAAFINAFVAATGKILLVPSGDYNITSNLFVEHVKKVYDEGSYVEIKPVYPVEKSILDGGINFSHKVAHFPLTASGNTYQAATYDSKRNKIVLGETTSDNSTQYIKIVNPETYVVENTYTYTTLGHINSMEYIADIDKILLGNVVGNKYYLIGDGSAIDTERSVYITGLATCYDDKMKIYVSNSLRNLYVTGYDGTLLKTIDTSNITDIETPWYNNGIIIGNELLYSEAGYSGEAGHAHVFSLNDFSYKGKIRLCNDGVFIEDFFVINKDLYAIGEGGYLWKAAMWKSTGVESTLQPALGYVKGDTFEIHAIGLKGDNNKYIEVYYQLGGQALPRTFSYQITGVLQANNITDGTFVKNTTMSNMGITVGATGSFDLKNTKLNYTPWTFDTTNTTSILQGTSKLFRFRLTMEVTS